MESGLPAGREPSALQYRTANGEARGFIVTPRDKQMLMALTRWYALTTPSLYKQLHLEEKEKWSPYHGADPLAFRRGHELFTELKKLRNRLGMFRAVIDDPANGYGPFARSSFLTSTQQAWFALPLGARACGLDGWVRRHSVNLQSVEHALAASDIAAQIESYGWVCASERELLHGRLVDNTPLSADFTSIYRPPGTAREVLKRPDVAVMSPDGSRYIAVEIERNKYRASSNYIEKLKAYSRNPSIDAVWYMCVDQNTADRVIEAATIVFKDAPHARVRVRTADTQYGFWHIETFNNDDNPEGMYDAELATDLTTLLQRRARRGILYQGAE